MNSRHAQAPLLQTETGHTVRYVRAPDLIWPDYLDIPKEVRVLSVLWMSLRQTRFGIDRFQSHYPHQAAYSFVIHFLSLRFQPFEDFSHSVKRRTSILLIDQVHQPYIVRRLAFRLIIPAGSGYPQQLALARNRNARMIRLDLLPPFLNGTGQTFFLPSPVPLSTGRFGGTVPP